MNVYKKIYKEIKKHNKIVLVRHIGPDPDALGSTLGLKEVILNTFPKKLVYAVGTPAAKHKYIGELDTFDESMYEDSLLIVLDTPDIKRVDGVDPTRFKKKIKIDHHPIVDEYCDIEFVDDNSSSACELVMQLIFNTPLKLNDASAEKLYIGLISDTNRFLYSYTTEKTFYLVSRLLSETNIDITSIYKNMYLMPIAEKRLQAYVIQNINLTENKLGYLIVNQEKLDELNTDAATITNIVNYLNYTEEMISWVICAYDKNVDKVRASIRSRGPIINIVATHYNGGGHAYASGARLKDFDEVVLMIKELDKVCAEYNEKSGL